MKNFKAAAIIKKFLLLFITFPRTELMSLHSSALQREVTVASTRGSVTL